MDIAKVKEFLASSGEPEFRLRQLIKNYYSGRYADFDSMTDISKPLRQELTNLTPVLSVKEDLLSKSTKSEKVVLSLADGLKIESVLMNYGEWVTACISSQVGCPLGCTFCATGKMGLKRNLTSEEIVDQIIYWNHHLYPQYIGRVVFMGMGEPFLNWQNLLAAIEIINSKTGLNLGSRKISISTAGVVDKIYEFSDLNTEINLAISLHSPLQASRVKIMPIAKSYPLDQLIEAAKYYVNKTRRQLFFEYALIDQFNDSVADAKRLSALMNSHRLFYLNIIPLNRVPGGLTPSTQNNFNIFIDMLNKANVSYSVRQTFGSDINSACGQLITRA